MTGAFARIGYVRAKFDLPTEVTLGMTGRIPAEQCEVI